MHSRRYRAATPGELDDAAVDPGIGPTRYCTDEQRWNDGAYLLGSLPLTERQAYERHLADCPFCRANIRRLAGLPGLLRLVREKSLADPAIGVPRVRRDDNADW